MRAPPPLHSNILTTTLLLALPVTAFELAVLWYNDLRFGNPLYTGYFQEGFTADMAQSVSGLIFSPGRSIFLFSPPILLSLACLPFFPKKWLPEGLTIAALSILFFGLYAKWSGWEGGWGWGPRYLLVVVPFLVVLLLPALQCRQTWPKAIVLGLSLVGLLIQSVAVLTNFNDYYVERTLVQGLDFWRTVYDWGQSPIPGHIGLLARGMIDPWFLRLVGDGAPGPLHALVLVPLASLFTSCLLIGRGLTHGFGDR